MNLCTKLYSIIVERHFKEKGNRNLTEIMKYSPTLEEWTARRTIIQNGILRNLGLEPLPKRTELNPILHSLREYKDYTVQNLYFQSIPGIYITGNLYAPLKSDRPRPVMLIPHGHFKLGRFEPDFQHLAATLARMGVVAMTYDMIGYNDNRHDKHEIKHSGTFQLWNSIRVLDFLLSLPNVNSNYVGITGASGGATQAFLLTAVDSRIRLSIPAVMVSSSFYGGCVCESGLPIHRDSMYSTNNAEIAAICAPRPQLLISIGRDWTRFTPMREFPYLKSIYRHYNAESQVENIHLIKERHNYGPRKRQGAYQFIAKHFHLSLTHMKTTNNEIDESVNQIEEEKQMSAWNDQHPYPVDALKGETAMLTRLKEYQSKKS